MIAKKAKFKPSSASALPSAVKNLLNYIANPEKKNREEKVMYQGVRNFISDDHEAIINEMTALALCKKKNHDTVINHWVFSWHEDEIPTKGNVEELVSVFVSEAGLENHQCFYGLHKDTDNIHLHLAFNRVDPYTEKVTRINKGFDKLVGQKAIAKIEALQGWKPEKNSMFEYDIDNDEYANVRRVKGQSINTEAKRYEIETGAMSAQSFVQEVLFKEVKNAKTWQEFHNILQKNNCKYVKKGSGAVIQVGDVFVKSSSLGRGYGYGSLVKRFGDFEEAISTIKNTESETKEPKPMIYKSRLIKPEHEELWLEYQEYLEVVNNSRKEFKAYMDGIERDYKTQYNNLRQEITKENKEKLSQSFKGKGTEKNTLKSKLSEEKRERLSNLRALQRSNIYKIKTNFYETNKRYPFEGWLLLHGRVEEAFTYRCQENSIRYSYGEREERLKTGGGFFVADIVGYQVHTNYLGFLYYRNGEHYASFVDCGNKIIVNDLEYNSIAESIKLMQGRYKDLTFDGSEAFVKLCNQIQKDLTKKEDGKEMKREDSANDFGEEIEKKDLGASHYFSSLDCDRVRVSCIKFGDNTDDKAVFIFNRTKGFEEGFTQEQLQSHMPELQRLEARGENIYYTPLSDTKHHILIDDLSPESLQTFYNDGYEPAIVLESSPSNYQAIITIPKLGTKYDREIGNEISKILNTKYGDKNLSGCIHPHRAPSFKNLKPDNVKKNSIPTVKLISHEKRVCSKTYETTKELTDIYAKTMKEQEARREQRKRERTAERSVGGYVTPTQAYYNHLDNIQKHLSIDDNSKVDAMIAVRMRATGHSPEAIKTAIEECAPDWRGVNPEDRTGHNWKDYASRTTDYAFSPRGTSEIQRYEHYKQHWERIETGGQETQKRQKM